MAKEPFQMTDHELHELLKTKKISSAELTRSVFQRIDAVEHGVHAYITLTRDLALQQAAAADSQIKQGAVAPLTGIPLAIKCILCTHSSAWDCVAEVRCRTEASMKTSGRFDCPKCSFPLCRGFKCCVKIW